MESKTSGGISFLGLLQIAFIVLKLCGVINWKWLWVLSPTWIPMALIVVVVFALIFIPLFFKFIKDIFKG